MGARSVIYLVDSILFYRKVQSRRLTLTTFYTFCLSVIGLLDNGFLCLCFCTSFFPFNPVWNAEALLCCWACFGMQEWLLRGNGGDAAGLVPRVPSSHSSEWVWAVSSFGLLALLFVILIVHYGLLRSAIGFPNRTVFFILGHMCSRSLL
jgi:hypothetical protein